MSALRLLTKETSDDGQDEGSWERGSGEARVLG